METKDVWRKKLRRRHIDDLSVRDESGKMAEKLRSEEVYRKARRLFVTPDRALRQIRINCLLDGKQLVMPSTGLREGFFLLKPHTIPFSKLGLAATGLRLKEYGRRYDPQRDGRIDLLLTGAVAVDHDGRRLGSGAGFFDLTCSILAAERALTGEAYTAAVISRDQLTGLTLPEDPWDVRMNGVLTIDGLQSARLTGQQIFRIHWDRLSADRIKKIQPLFQLWHNQDEAGHGRE
jgi:5-formyltetrahydrofolate cyclo-ligase